MAKVFRMVDIAILVFSKIASLLQRGIPWDS